MLDGVLDRSNRTFMELKYRFAGGRGGGIKF